MIQFGYLPSGTLLNMEIEALCALLRGIGYEGIELLPQLALGDSIPQARVLRAVRDNDLQISEVVLQRDFVTPDGDEREAAICFVEEALPRVADLGVRTVNLFTGPQPWLPHPVRVGADVTATQAWEWVFAAFDRLLPAAEKHSIRIAVENVYGMMAHDIYTNLFLQDHYRSPSLGVNLDPSHDVLYDNTDMSFLVNTWGKDRIFHIHLKDAVGVPQNGKFVFPLLGEGEVNWQDFFDALSRIGYDGYASVEFESWRYIHNLLDGSNIDCAELSFRAIQKLIKKGRAFPNEV